MTRIDLHMHSTASDGVFSPAEVVALAQTHQLDVIALTDHDSTNGVKAAQHAALGSALTVLSGIELSCEDAVRDVHLLGYLVDVSDGTPLQAMLLEMRAARVNRAELIVKKLAAFGVEISVERIRELAGNGAVGRPHIAQAILEKGYVSSRQEAFDKYIENNGPAYVPRYQLDPRRAIDLIHNAGGVAVVAHPVRYAQPEAVVRELAAAGVDGVEVFYPDHTPELVAHLSALARDLHLIMTGGSDFHRRAPDGSARIGTVKVPEDVVEALQARQAHLRQSA